MSLTRQRALYTLPAWCKSVKLFTFQVNVQAANELSTQLAGTWGQVYASGWHLAVKPDLLHCLLHAVVVTLYGSRADLWAVRVRGYPASVAHQMCEVCIP
jgi:hypothetical protein